jgi:hypothetical protein
MTPKTYDPACYDLASQFLQDVQLAGEKQCDELARAIQQAVEDYIFDFESNRDMPDPPGFEGGFADNH